MRFSSFRQFREVCGVVLLGNFQSFFDRFLAQLELKSRQTNLSKMMQKTVKQISKQEFKNQLKDRQDTRKKTGHLKKSRESGNSRKS